MPFDEELVKKSQEINKKLDNFKPNKKFISGDGSEKKVNSLSVGHWFTPPIYKDWIPIAWFALTVLAWLPAIYRVLASGGPFFTASSIFSGLIDGAVYPFTLLFIFVLPMSLIRKIYWNFTKKQKITLGDRYIVALLLILVISAISAVSYLNYQANIANEKSLLKTVCVDSAVVDNGCTNYPNIQFDICINSENASADFYLNPEKYSDNVDIPLIDKKINYEFCPEGYSLFSFRGEGIVDLLGGEYGLWLAHWSGDEDYFRALESERFLTKISFEVK
jgi:hypothetical protein